MAFVRKIEKERKKEKRKKESIVFAVILPMTKIVQSMVQNYCDMVMTHDNSSTCTKTCLNTTLPITNPILTILVSILGN